MPTVTCNNDDCKKIFYSHHSVAKFCSQSCAAKWNFKKRKILLKRRNLAYSKEQLLEYLKAFAQQLGRTPSCRDMDTNKNLPHSRTYAYQFGSWIKALELANLPLLPYGLPYSNNGKHTGKRNGRYSLRFKILKRDKFRCRYCGATPEDGRVLHIDHIIPKSKGGKNSEDNLITSCHICNLGKYDSILDSSDYIRKSSSTEERDTSNSEPG